MKIKITSTKKIGADGKPFWISLATTGEGVKPYHSEAMHGDTLADAEARAAARLWDTITAAEKDITTHYELDLETGQLS